mgnify:CR=1 FL=1
MDKHIVIFSSEFPNPKIPTQGVFTAELVRELKKHVAISVICPVPERNITKLFKKSVSTNIPDTAKVLGCNVFYPRFPALPFIGRVLNGLILAIACQKTLKKIQQSRVVDILHIHSAFPEGVAGVLLGKWLKLKTVVTALGSEVHTEMPKFSKKWQMLWALHRASAITAVSDDLCQRLRQYGLQTTKIPTGVCQDKFNSQSNPDDLRQRLNIESDTPLILFVGRLHPIKSIDTLILAAAQLMQRNRKFSLVIVGDGGEASRLKQMVEELKLSAHIYLIGSQAHSDIAGWMQTANVLCLSSKMEGLPNVILEALTMSLPVVASDVGGIPEAVIDGHNGYLVPPGDIDQLADALDKALSRDWDKQQICNSIQWASWKNVTAGYFEIYRALTATNSLHE